MKRKVFYSFHYSVDAWRAGQVRNIGVVIGNKPATDNDWEKVKQSGDAAIKKWIDDQMNDRSCTIVLVGSKTATRRWVKYEIKKSIEKDMGIVGIYIHGLKNVDGNTSTKGCNPFNSYQGISCVSPKGRTSQEKFNWISKNLATIIEKAIAETINTKRK